MPDTTLSVQSFSDRSPLTTVQAGRFTIMVDEPEAFGGQNTAPSPILYLLASLAGCVHAAGRIAAEELQLNIGRIDVSVQGDTNADRFFGKITEDRSGFRSLKISIQADTGEPDASLQEWLKQIQYRCPVLDNILAATPVVIDLNYTLSIGL